ncbi:MAG: hypothetical protein ABF868_04060 [Sporolactobacillus sp.]
MASIRQDAWSDADDARLAETVLSHIQKGSTQLAGFAEAGQLLSRTAAACGFRWNSLIRKRHAAAIAEAKALRRTARAAKQDRGKNGADITVKSEDTKTLKRMITLLDCLRKQTDPFGDEEAIQALKCRYDKLDEDYRSLKAEHNKLVKNYACLQRAVALIDEAHQQSMAMLSGDSIEHAAIEKR